MRRTRQHINRRDNKPRLGICRNCGKPIEEWEVLKLPNTGTEITRRKIHYQLKIYKGTVYEQTVRLDTVSCLETWTAISLPKFLQVSQAVSA
jgi:hypothetical protein